MQLDKKPAVVVRHPQTYQLMSERRILGFKPALRLDGAAKAASTKHSSAIIVRDVRRFFRLINADEVLGTHNCHSALCKNSETWACRYEASSCALSL